VTGGHEVEPGVLEGIASTLRKASSDVDGLAGSVPATPDAGDGTAAIASILSKLVDSAGQFVVGAAAAGDAVAQGKANYTEGDAAARDAVLRSGGARAE
jgi:hypothetical protein